MEKFDEDMKKLYAQSKVPDLPQEKYANLEQAVLQNKKTSKSKKLVFWQRFAIVCCCLLVILPCVLVPVLWPKGEERYYSDDDVVQTKLTLEFVQEFFAENYNQYSFIFDECTTDGMYGFYEKKSNKLLAINIFMWKIDFSPSTLDLNLVMDKKYKFASDDKYRNGATKSIEEGYTLYQKTVASLRKVEIWALKEYKNYNLYLNFGIQDQEFFEKFL